MKKSKYNYVFSKFNYTLICNGRKGTVIVLDPETTQRYKTNTLNENEIKQLYKMGMLIEENVDETDLFLTESRFATSKMDRLFFRVYTTMACNAKCPYCYEKGLKAISMTKEIASQVCDYIISSITTEQLVIIEWFGGEPLCNHSIISYISKILVPLLEKRGIKYYSNMVSNGYLFNPTLICEAVDVWKLRKIQITLDGTESVYEKIKQFGDKQSFQKVIENIRLLTNNSIFVNVRINYDEQNFQDVCNLVDYLSLNFSDNKFFGLYGHKIMSENQNNSFVASQDLDLRFLKKLVSSKFPNNFLSTLNPRMDICFAYLIKGGLIYPNGDIYKCSKVAGNEEEKVSNIFECYYNNNIGKWCSPKLPQLCIECQYLPLCNGGCLNERRLKKESCFISKKILEFKLETILTEYISKKQSALNNGCY